jgi:hypothetical protein
MVVFSVEGNPVMTPHNTTPHHTTYLQASMKTDSESMKEIL